MKKSIKSIVTLVLTLSLMMSWAIVAYADEAPIPPKTPQILTWGDTTITVAAENGWEYMIRSVDGQTVSNWNQPSYQDLIEGKLTFKFLKPGMGYNVYARAQGTDDRKAWDLNIDDDTWSPAYVVTNVTFEGVVSTPNYPRDIEELLPAYVYIYDMETGEEVAPLLTEWNGHFKGNAYGNRQPGTYKLVAYSSKNSAYRIEDTITVPVYEMKKYEITNTPPQTQPATQATTVATQPATEATTVATQPVTEPVTQPVTEPATQPVTEPVTQPVTQPATQPQTQATQPQTQATRPVQTTAAATQPATTKPAQTTAAATQPATTKPAQTTAAATKPAETTVAATEATTEAATEATTEAATEAVTEATTEAVTEATTAEMTTASTTAAATEAAAPVKDNNSGNNTVFMLLGIIIAILVAVGVVFGIKKFGNK